MPQSKIESRKAEVLVLSDRAALEREAAQRLVSIARRACAARKRFSLALSGGSTPRDLYQLLATPEFSSQIDWSRTHLFWGDERAAPPDHPDSNYRMANEALISRVPIPPENVHRIRAERAPTDAAHEYEQTLATFFSLNVPPPLSGGKGGEADARSLPRLDLILLGIGEDAHTASLFPHTTALHETTRWVVANYVEKLKACRITLTPPILNAAEYVLFLAAGAEKAEAVHAVLQGDHQPDEFPAQLVQPTNGGVTWLLDQEASVKLEVES